MQQTRQRRCASLATDDEGANEANSIHNSPKAKSAPATPCNITPVTNFHQHTFDSGHHNSNLLLSQMNPSPANTLPPDLRKNISATCRVLPSSILQQVPPPPMQIQPNAAVAAPPSSPAPHNSQEHMASPKYMDELIKRGETLLEAKDYNGAIRLFDQCIELATANNQNIDYLKQNFKVYVQRAEAHLNLGNHNEAIENSMAARDLNPKCTQAYYIQGKAQFLIGKDVDALAVFSFGLTQDPTNKRLFEALIDAALKSSFKQDFEPKYNELKSIDMDKRLFVVVSVLGQDLLARGHCEHSAIVLESALKLGPDNSKFKSSVLSSIAYAYYLIKDYDKAIGYMQKELAVESELEDVSSQCKIYSNLGHTYYKIRKFDNSLEAHRKQLKLALRAHLFQQASMALNAIGHVHAARNDYNSSLTSHTRCLEILKQLGDNDYTQYKELLSIGYIYSMLNDFKSAEEKYNDAVQLLESSRKISRDEYQTGLVMVNFNLAYMALKRQSFNDAERYYRSVCVLAQNLPNPRQRALIEMRTFNGLGHVYRLLNNLHEARNWFEKQLHIAESLQDLVGQSQALCNLGMTHQYFKEYPTAWKYFENNLRLVDKDPLLKAYAHSYIAGMHFHRNRYNEAHNEYENSINLFNNFDYCSSEKKTIEINLAIVDERLGHLDGMSVAEQTQQKELLMAQ